MSLFVIRGCLFVAYFMVETYYSISGSQIVKKIINNCTFHIGEQFRKQAYSDLEVNHVNVDECCGIVYIFDGFTKYVNQSYTHI